MKVSFHESDNGLPHVRFQTQTEEETRKVMKMHPAKGFKLEWRVGDLPQNLELCVVPEGDNSDTASPDIDGLDLAELKTLAAESGVELPKNATRVSVLKALKDADVD